MKDYCPAAIINYCAVHLIAAHFVCRRERKSALLLVILYILYVCICVYGCVWFLYLRKGTATLFSLYAAERQRRLQIMLPGLFCNQNAK